VLCHVENADDLNREQGRASMKSKESLKEQGYTLAEEGVPPFGRPVTVVTADFCCIGFLDRSQNWRHFKDHGLIRNVIAWTVSEYEQR